MAGTITLTGAEALVRLLEAEQVAGAFGLVGGKLAPLLQALSRSTIGFFGVRHEASAAMMAAAVNAASGRVALAIGEMGPGALNLAAGTGVAFNNRLAMLLVTSNQHRAAAYPHRGMFMDLDTRALLAPITQWQAVVNDVRRLPELVRTAFREALSGRPGPVHLDIPQDVLAARAEWDAATFDLAPARYRPVHAPRPAAAALAEAAQALQSAQRPLIIAGGGVVVSGAGSAVRALAVLLQAPVVPTQMGLGVVASDSRHFIGQGGLIGGSAVRQAFAQADVVLALGCRFSSWLWDEHGPLVRPTQTLLNVNLDPAALGSPALHGVALQADAAAACGDLLATLRAGATHLCTEPGWLDGLRAERGRYEGVLADMAADTTMPMHPAALATALGRALPDDALVVFDGGHTSFWSNDLTPVAHERTRFHDPGMCQLGFGLPYALALQRLHPGRSVLNITGDGSFGFTLQELDSARRHRLPVITVIHNNAAWGIIREGQRKQWDFECGSTLEGTDHAAIARGFGCHGETVHSPAELGPALERARASGLPAVIDCHTRFVPHPSLPAFGSMNRFGFDASGVRPI